MAIIAKTTTIRLSWALNIMIYDNINILPIPVLHEGESLLTIPVLAYAEPHYRGRPVGKW